MTKTNNIHGNITVIPAFALYFLYAVWVWLCDAADLLCYLTGLTQCTLQSRVLVSAVVIAAVYMLRRYVTLRRTEKDRLYYVLAAVILAFAIHKAIILDYSVDTNNYHVIVQNPGFFSATKDHFMLADFQMYGFRWGDRLFYGFRYLLGYRMGTVLTGFVAVLLYTQVRELLQLLLGERLAACRARSPRLLGWLFGESMLAFCVTLVSELVIQQGVYMIDTLFMPFAMEALLILLLTWNKPQNGMQMVWFAVLNGFYFACKMTHIVYAAPMILMYLFLHRKELTVKRFAAAFVVAFSPVCVYLLYNFAETGNPVFPYFNSLFQSPYFGTEDFKDTRWGPADWKDLLFWPYLSNTNPYYRLSEVPNQFPLGTTMYMVVTGLCALKWITRRKRERTESVLLFVLVLVTFYLWAATTGHSRYYMLGYIITGILVVDFLTDIYAIGGTGARLAVWVPVLILMVQPWVLMESVSGGFEYAWRNSRDGERVKDNLEYVLRDQNGSIAGAEDFPDPDMILVTRGAFGSVCNLLYPDTPIVYYSYLQNRAQPSVQAEWEPKVREALDSDIVYELHMARYNGLEWKDYFAQLTQKGIRAEAVYWRDSIFSADDDLIVVKLRSLQAGEENTVLYGNGEDTITAPAENVRFRADITMSEWKAVGGPVTVSVVATDGVREEVVYTTSVDMRETLSVDTWLDLTAFDETVSLRFRCSFASPEQWPPLVCLIFNPTLSS